MNIYAIYCILKILNLQDNAVLNIGEIYMVLGNLFMKIKEIRKLTSLTQEQFSKQYNIPLPTLRHWERGDRECPNYVLELLEFKVKNDYKK